MNKTLQDLKIAEKVAQDNYCEEEAQAALDLATDAEKQRDAGSILFVISGAGLVSRCRIPVAVVAQRGLQLFRILLGSEGPATVIGMSDKSTADALYAKATTNNAQTRLFNAARDKAISEALSNGMWLQIENLTSISTSF